MDPLETLCKIMDEYWVSCVLGATGVGVVANESGRESIGFQGL